MLYALNFEIILYVRSKNVRLEPVRVRHSKYPLFLLTHRLNTAWSGINVQQVMT